MSYLDMNGTREEHIEVSNLEEGSRNLPRPPFSTYQRIQNLGLQPRRVYDIEDVIEHTILLNEHLRRDRQTLNCAMCSLLKTTKGSSISFTKGVISSLHMISTQRI